jgi:hypothetical protein
MANARIDRLIEGLEDDLPRSRLMREKVPALARAFEAARIKPVLQAALVGPEDGRYSIAECIPGKALYLPDHNINMQYRLKIEDRAANQPIAAMINARIFKNRAECTSYLERILMPLAAKVNGRPEMQPFARPVASIEDPDMTLSVFPVDGLIPTLVDATDPIRIGSILAEALPEAVSGKFAIQGVQLLPAHYGRFERCVLRYSVDGRQTGTHTPRNVTVYGKVAADGSGGLTLPVIAALREKLRESDLPYQFRIPHALGYFPELQLLLMEALPGKPFFKELLKTWPGKGERDGKAPEARARDARLEDAVRTCARIAATLHGSGIQLGRPITLEMQITGLQASTEVLSPIFPDLGVQLKSWIDKTVEISRATPAMALCFSHGDFTYTQLIFDGDSGGLVDFDTVCQAEPAQDLGHYLAYQRLNIIKDQDPNAPFAPESIERLCALFLDTYIEAARAWIADERVLRSRVAVFELVSLIRLALHSWEKMKGSRLKQTLALLEERIECQNQTGLALKNKTS